MNHPKLHSQTESISSARNDGPATEPAFVGRRPELDTLLEVLDSAGSGPRFALIHGETGIGKTALAAEATRRRAERLLILKGTCYHVPEAGAYFPFLQVLDQMRLRAAKPVDFLVHLADGFQGIERRDGVAPDPGGRRARFLRALTNEIVDKAVRSPTVLIIEDIQWADVGSLLLLNNLADIAPPGLTILCTVRTDELIGPDLGQLIMRLESKSLAIPLGPLSHAEAAEYVRSLLPAYHISHEEVSDLVSFTRGNPLFIKELTLHFLETGMLDQHRISEGLARSRTPRRLSQLVDRRLRSLPGRPLNLLSVAAVLGLRFKIDDLTALEGRPAATAEDLLEEALQTGIVRKSDRLDADEYEFTHPLYATRIYENLPPSRRRSLHGRIASAIDAGHISRPVSELARHYALGHGAAKDAMSLGLCRAAAEEAEHLLAYETAGRFWELALRCVRDEPRTKADLSTRLGWALWAAGKWTRAGEAWQTALQLLESLGESERAGHVALALGEMRRWGHELGDADRWLRFALDRLPEGSEQHDRARALLGSVYSVREKPAQALEILKAVAFRPSLDDRHRDPAVSYWLSFGFLTSGHPAEAYKAARVGLAEARRRGDSHGSTLLAGTLMHHELSILRPGHARRFLRIVEESVDPTDTVALTRSLVCRTVFDAYHGNWLAAAEACERWMSQVRLAGNFHRASARMHWSVAKFALGQAARAADEMQRALPDLQDMRPLAATHLARVMVDLGKLDEARSLVNESLTVFDTSRFSMGRAVLADVVTRLRDRDLCERCFDALRKETRPVVLVYCPISVQRVLGRLAASLGAWTDAASHFETALSQLEGASAHWEMAQTLLDYAWMRRLRRRRGDGTKAASLETRARSIFQRLKIAPPTADVQASQDGNRFGLTGREIEVLSLAATGQRNQEIASALSVSARTVDRHLENIFAKMGVGGRTEAVVSAIEEGIIGASALSHARSTPYANLRGYDG